MTDDDWRLLSTQRRRRAKRENHLAQVSTYRQLRCEDQVHSEESCAISCVLCVMTCGKLDLVGNTGYLLK
jgi:hypothetical protein